MNKIVLASGSPRRRELLTAMGVPHIVQGSDVDESEISADHPRTYALRAAYAKAQAVAETLSEGTIVLAADTIVTRQLVLYGKPADAEEARRVLQLLSGLTHEVITAVAVARAGSMQTAMNSCTTRVTFRSLTNLEIDAYVSTGEPMDKAGAYGIQGRGGDLIESIEGDYFNVVGLPCSLVAEMLSEEVPDLRLTVPEPPARWVSAARR